MNVCWLISGQNQLFIAFQHFDTDSGYDIVRIYDGVTTSSPLLFEASGRLQYGFNNSAVSSTNKILVVFTSDLSSTDHGFEAIYTSCSVLTDASGNISSSNYPNNYKKDDSVCWIMSPPVGSVVKLKFNNFQTEADYDFVRVFDGSSMNSPQLLSVSGNSIPSLLTTITSTSNRMLVVFSSDGSGAAKGFQATFNTLAKGTTSGLPSMIYLTY